MVREEGVGTLEAPLVIVLKKKKKREKERGREKGYGRINFSAQAEHNRVLYFYSISGGLGYNYTVKRAGVATHCRTKDFHLGKGVGSRTQALERNSEFCDRPKKLQNNFFLENGNLSSSRCLCKRQLCGKVQQSIQPEGLDVRCPVPLAQLTYPHFFPAVQELTRVLAHHLLALSLPWNRGLGGRDKAT